MKTVWQKDDQQVHSAWFFEFTAAEDRLCDEQLIPYDIICNIAQVHVLHKAKLLNKKDTDMLLHELKSVYRLWEEGEFGLTKADEDVHSAIERHLTDQLGDAGKKIHAGRSRNDLVIADVRLYIKENIRKILDKWIGVIRALRTVGINYKGVFLPGYTHTQPAMPNSVDAWCSGYIELLISAAESLKQAYESIDTSPLGAAAGFGVPYFDIDRELYASLLGFENVQYSVNTVQLSRGYQGLRLLHALQYGASMFNRLAADIVFYAGADKGFISLSDDQVSGSSIMPQKKNPDVWELIRGFSHEFEGLVTQLQSTTTNMTSGYHRDLQTIKKLTMAGISRTIQLCDASSKALKGVSFNEDTCYEALDSSLFATHLANSMTLDGMPFREAYRKAAREYADKPVPSKEELSECYHHLGAPGQCDTSYFNPAIETLSGWVENEETKWKEVKDQLLS